MEKDPATIRLDIDATRERLGDTVEALAYKTDVPARTKDAVTDKVESVKQTVSDVVGTAAGKLSSVVSHDGVSTSAPGDTPPPIAKLRDTIGGVAADARDAALNASQKLPDGGDARAALGNAKGIMQDNPLGVVLGSVAVGLIVGSFLPVSALERKQIGPIGEKLTANARAAATDLVDHGKAAVTQVVGDALSGKSTKPVNA